MDALTLSRLQFAMTTAFHFLFVPLTLGLSLYIAFMETRYVRNGDREALRSAQFWGRIFLVNFAVGVVTGITLEFQFGTNWSRYAQYVGDVFGSLLAIEATVAFFLESTFVAVWAFGWRRLSPRAHATSMWLVAGAATISAVWILLANAWMQHPVGYALRSGRAELENLRAIISHGFGWHIILHTLLGAYILTGFVLMAVSAYHLLRRQNTSFFTTAFRHGLTFALVFSVAQVVQGHLHGAEVAKIQPTKLAAMEALWETQTRAPQVLLAIPEPAAERNRWEIGRIPAALSLLAYHRADAEVQGLRAFPVRDRPPVAITFLAFRIMVALGFLFVALAAIGFFQRHRPADSPRFLRLVMWSLPLPYLAIQTGWIVTEVGRQPWIVYGLMRTEEALAPLSTHQVAGWLAVLFVLYALLGVAAFTVCRRFAIQGPPPLAPQIGNKEG